jgi:cell fate (sporulation/competence/biofilm development) regulator YlbF (YheA/YmcA/DUF963 family)
MENTQYANNATENFQRIQLESNAVKLDNNIVNSENNWAFIDMQNVYKEVQKNGWKIQWKLFRKYLERECKVAKAVVFMGYIKENKGFYNFLERAGFTMELRKVYRLKDGRIEGGNIQ